MKFFNTAGPCNPVEHYMLPAQERCQGIHELIDQKLYFVIHASRQSGKTTLLKDLAAQINDKGQYYGLYCSLEALQNVDKPEDGIPAIVQRLKLMIELHSILSKYSFASDIDRSEIYSLLIRVLTFFCKSLDKPLVILFDEADCLSNGTLISFFRQLRDGYINRYDIPFVHSVALVGMRNIRDYKARIRDERETLGSASPFNIVTKTLTLRNFNYEEISLLYLQHTKETGQVFSYEVIEKVFYYTQGQPWLVNAIAREVLTEILKNDYSNQVLPEHVDQAVETIIKRRDTHIDSLMERLREPRVQRIVEPVILGEIRSYDILDDDYQYILDLGLLTRVVGQLQPSNPIYGEVIMRTLSSRAEMEMESLGFPEPARKYLVNGRIDMHRLLTDFQKFWRTNSEIWKDRFDYKEAAAHLVFHAFLQRLINGGGNLGREVAAGRGRLDSCLWYEDQVYPIELKLRYNEETYAEGKAKIVWYMDRLGCNEGWLIVFDRRNKVAWDKKIFWKTESVAGKTVHIVGC